MDLIKAFDCVDYIILIEDIARVSHPDQVRRGLCGHMRGRQTYVEFRGAENKKRKLRSGLPQGEVFSPNALQLLNEYLA